MSSGLLAIDVVAAIFVVIGFHLAFRQAAVRSWMRRLRGPQPRALDAEDAGSRDPEGVAAVLRMVGVMIMAFSFTIAAFANLIARYTAASAG